jgi:mannose-6-phosphate isomerase-like protein (cupin superfamily)
MRPTHIRRGELERLSGKVQADGGELLQLSGSDYDLSTSVMSSTVMPGSGPRRHRHPHAEIFAFHEGRARVEVDGTYLDVDAGDFIIVPANTWHGFTNTGPIPIREIAIHENSRAVTEFEDGSLRD